MFQNLSIDNSKDANWWSNWLMGHINWKGSLDEKITMKPEMPSSIAQAISLGHMISDKFKTRNRIGKGII